MNMSGFTRFFGHRPTPGALPPASVSVKSEPATAAEPAPLMWPLMAGTFFAADGQLAMLCAQSHVSETPASLPPAA